jgi:hypothetical protein
MYVTPIDPINIGFERIWSPQPEVSILGAARFDRYRVWVTNIFIFTNFDLIFYTRHVY